MKNQVKTRPGLIIPKSEEDTGSSKRDDHGDGLIDESLIDEIVEKIRLLNDVNNKSKF